MQKRNIIKTVTIALSLSFIGLLLVTAPVHAIPLPDSTPTVEHVYIWRNALETGDMLIILKENTPYASYSTNISYSEAFIWRLIDTDGTTELGQALGFNYNDNGYNYNVIGFYFSAADNITWGQNYFLRLSGTPSAFASPPEYNYPVNTSYYSSLNVTAEVQTDIASKIILLATELNSNWGLTSSYYLTTETEIATVLSIYGEAFFRGALYGCQAYAPAAFSLSIYDIEGLDNRTWTQNYTNALEAQYAGTYIETGIEAGKSFFNIGYNLAGMLGTLALMAAVITGSIMLSGDWWSAAIGASAVLVIMTRMGMFGLGECGLIAALGWLFVSAKIWKVI